MQQLARGPWKNSALNDDLSSGQHYRDTEILPTYRDFAKTPAYRQVGMPTLTPRLRRGRLPATPYTIGPLAFMPGRIFAHRSLKTRQILRLIGVNTGL